MLYKFAIISSILALTLTGCADKNQENKENFAKVIKSAKNSDLLIKIDKKLGNIMNEVAAKPGLSLTKPTLNDERIAQRATKALLAYVESDNTNAMISNTLVHLISTAHRMYSGNAAQFDAAVNRLEMTLVTKLGSPNSALEFPNYEPYDFVRAVFHILTDKMFGIDHTASVTRALKCASGASEMCDGRSNELVQKMLSAMSRINDMIPPEVVVHESLGKLIFLPIYVFLNHESVPVEFRQWTVHIVNALVELVANAPKDPQQAQEYFASALEMIQFTDAEMHMITNIGRNVERLMSKLDMSGFMRHMNPQAGALQSNNPVFGFITNI